MKRFKIGDVVSCQIVNQTGPQRFGVIAGTSTAYDYIVECTIPPGRINHLHFWDKEMSHAVISFGGVVPLV